MKIICCKCKKEYSFGDNIFEYNKDTNCLILICPYCGLKHAINFMPFEKEIKAKKIKRLDLGGGAALVILGASRIANATRVDQSAVDDGDIIQGTPWDISTFRLGPKSFEISEDDNPVQVFIRPDGLKMYVLGYTSKMVYQYSLTIAWDPGTAVYDEKSFTITQDPYVFGLSFKPDGTEMYVVGQSSDSVYQFSLSTAWGVDTASYNNKTYSVTSQVTSPSGVTFKPDGLKMYVTNAYSVAAGVYQYSLTTEWDVTSASYGSKKLDTITQTTSPYTAFFKPDGLNLYVMGYGDDTIFQYSLSVAWDMDTATYDNKNYVLTPQETKPYGLYMKSDGLELSIVGTDFKKIRQYVMKTAWNKTNDFILATRIYGSKGPYARAYKLRWRVSSGTFVDVSDIGAITYSAVTDLADGGDLLEEEKLCDAQGGYTWQNGLENEGDNLLPDSGTYSLADEYYTEFQWALSCNDAEDGAIYEFELWDVTEGVTIGTCLANITMGIVAGLINGYFMGNGVREEKIGYYMNSIEEFGYYMYPKI